MTMVLLYILATMWLIGCLFGIAAAIYTIYSEDSPLVATVVALIGIPLACLGGMLPFGYFASEDSPTLAALKKGDWVCSAHHYTTTTTYVKSGSVMVPVTTRQKVCDQYNKVP